VIKIDRIPLFDVSFPIRPVVFWPAAGLKPEYGGHGNHSFNPNKKA
jgi:hypothetical protein